MSNSRKDVLRDARALKFVERTRVHVFHAVVYATLDEERAVEFYDLACDRTMKDIEFHDDGIELCGVEFKVYFLFGRGVVRYRIRKESKSITFMAMRTFVGLWSTFLTVP